MLCTAAAYAAGGSDEDFWKTTIPSPSPTATSSGAGGGGDAGDLDLDATAMPSPAPSAAATAKATATPKKEIATPAPSPTADPVATATSKASPSATPGANDDDSFWNRTSIPKGDDDELATPTPAPSPSVTATPPSRGFDDDGGDLEPTPKPSGTPARTGDDDEFAPVSPTPTASATATASVTATPAPRPSGTPSDDDFWNNTKLPSASPTPPGADQSATSSPPSPLDRDPSWAFRRAPASGTYDEGFDAGCLWGRNARTSGWTAIGAFSTCFCNVFGLAGAALAADHVDWPRHETVEHLDAARSDDWKRGYEDGFRATVKKQRVKAALTGGGAILAVAAYFFVQSQLGK